MKNVSHKKAPGAISAIALIVRPPRPSVGLVVGFSFDDMSFFLLISYAQKSAMAMSKRQEVDIGAMMARPNPWTRCGRGRPALRRRQRFVHRRSGRFSRSRARF